MKTEGCRPWRESLGAYALGQLPEAERAGLEAHLEGCPECGAELAQLESVARVMPLADPERLGSTPVPPVDLGDRVAATIAGERRTARRGRRLRLGLALGGATAAVATAVLAIFVLSSGPGVEPQQRVVFSSLPAKMEISATLAPRPYGTEIHMYVDGVPSGTLCRVSLWGPGGIRLPAGTFRYRYGEDDAVLSSALDLARTKAVVVHVGRRAFVASL